MSHERKLSTLRPGTKAIITRVDTSDSGQANRLLEMGFIEGSPIEVAHECPWGKDPFAVHVRGGLIALRRSDAELIFIEDQNHE